MNNRIDTYLQSSWMHPHLEARGTAKYGRGIFANEPIAKNERLAIFGGDIMFIEEIKDLPVTFRYFNLQIEERFVIGIRHPSQPESTDFFNHSCEPNAGLKGQIFLVAMRDIKKDEEITFDYAMAVSASVGSDFIFAMDCHCGSTQCRKQITEDDWKRPDLRKKYRGYFSQYLQEKIDSEGKS